MHGGDFGIAWRIAKEQAPGVGVVLNETEVGLAGGAEQFFGRSCSDRAGRAVDQRVGVAVEQLDVQLALGGKVVVEDGRDNPRACRDLGHRGALIPALGENLDGCLENALAALRPSQASSRR